MNKEKPKWEEEFDEEFVHISSWGSEIMILNTENPDKIKQFISKTIQAEREEMVERIQEYFRETMDSSDPIGIYLAKQVVFQSDIINLINKTNE